MSARCAIIGGSGFASLSAFDLQETRPVSTQYGEPSAPIMRGHFAGEELWFLPRHGLGHSIPPHLINYRANLKALNDLGVEILVSIAAVGGIGTEYAPGSLVVPDQILDYTYSREQTYFDGEDGSVQHIDFTQPYCEELRGLMLRTAHDAGIPVIGRGTYAATQGPRFESAAEIRRMGRDGGDVVGMTGMPETGLARELGICYATLAIVVNYAAGVSGTTITDSEIRSAFDHGANKAYRLLEKLVPKLPPLEFKTPPIITP